MTPDWQTEDGSIRLFCDDCLNVLPQLEAGSVDAVVTDPPYGIARENHGGMLETRPMIANDESQKVGQAVLDWASYSRLPTAAFASPRLPWSGNWRNLICWDKGGAVAGGGDPSKCLKLSWELIQVARNESVPYRDGSVWTHHLTQQNFEHHPNEKPLVIVLRVLWIFFAGCRVVLDPFMGSGTTGVACIRTGRRFIGIEKEERYFNIAVKRIQAELERCPLLEPAPKVIQRELLK